MAEYYKKNVKNDEKNCHEKVTIFHYIHNSNHFNFFVHGEKVCENYIRYILWLISLLLFLYLTKECRLLKNILYGRTILNICMYTLTPPYNIFMIQKLRSCFRHFSHEQFLEVKVKLSFALASPEVIAMIDHKNLIEVTFVFLLLAAQWIEKIKNN